MKPLHKNEIRSADLIDNSSLNNHNIYYNFILIVIDIFTKCV